MDEQSKEIRDIPKKPLSDLIIKLVNIANVMWNGGARVENKELRDLYSSLREEIDSRERLYLGSDGQVQKILKIQEYRYNRPH